MESFCLKCKKNTENIDPNVLDSSMGRTMILSKCAICGRKKSRFIKNQKAKGLLNKLGFFFFFSLYTIYTFSNKKFTVTRYLYI